MTRRRYPWPDVKQVYVEGTVDDKGNRDYPSLEKVADLFDIPPVRVREKSASEGWRDQRAAFQAHLEKVRQQKRAADMATEATDVDTKALNLAKMGFSLVQVRMGEILKAVQKKAEQQKERTASGQEPDEFEDMFSVVDAREVDTLAHAAAAWHQLALRAIGEVDTARLEITGPGGGPLEVEHSVSVRQELMRDDPERLYAFITALQRAGVQLPGLPALGPGDGNGAAPHP